jgi:DNA ligase-1
MLNSDEAYEIVCAIADLSGHSKQSYLKIQDPIICKYLHAAYDPYTKYFMTNCTKGTGEFHFDDLTWELLRQLSTRELSGAYAQVTVNSITTAMTPRSADMFSRILKKDLRMGMGAKSLNKVFPGLIPTHDVMLAKLFEVSRLKFPCFGSPKMDGVRSIKKSNKFYSRNGHEYVGLGHLIKELEQINTTKLDGELVVDGKTFQDGSGLIRSNDPTPNAQFHIFELPEDKGSFTQRLNMMMNNIHQIGPHIFCIPHSIMHNKDDVMKYYDKCRNAGYEGVVIKPYEYDYKGNRSYTWMKMKPTETVDLKVIGIYEGQGKYEGKMGGVEVMYNGKKNKIGGGWSDNQRGEYWFFPDKIIGKVIEVWFMEQTDDGNMRHARFVKFRPDKED